MLKEQEARYNRLAIFSHFEKRKLQDIKFSPKLLYQSSTHIGIETEKRDRK